MNHAGNPSFAQTKQLFMSLSSYTASNSGLIKLGSILQR